MEPTPHFRFFGTQFKNHWLMQQRTGRYLEQPRKGYQHSNLLSWKHIHSLGSVLCSHWGSHDKKHLSIQPNPCVISVLTCFGKVFPIVTEILEEGDTLAPRVVPPSCLQKHHLHTGSRPRTGAQWARPGTGGLEGKVYP